MMFKVFVFNFMKFQAGVTLVSVNFKPGIKVFNYSTRFYAALWLFWLPIDRKVVILLEYKICISRVSCPKRIRFSR